jgi:hypothetical protein
MNKATRKQVDKILALRDTGGFIPAALAQYAAQTLCAIHRSEGTKVQKEIEQEIDKCGLWSAIKTINGALVALED